MSAMAKLGKKEKDTWLGILFENNPLTKTKFNEALAKVQENFMEFYSEDFFLQLEIDTFCKLLESDDLNVPNEEVVFDSVRRWLDFNNLNPESYLKRLLKVVRLPLLPIKYLFEEIEPYVYSIPNCKEEFLDTLRYYHLNGNNNKIIQKRKYQTIVLEKNKTNECVEKPQTPTKQGKKLISIGSDDLKTANVVEIFDDNLNQWIKPKSIATDRRNYSVAFIDTKLMLIGGTQSPNKDNEPVNTVQSLDLSSGILSTESSLNEARQYAAAVVVGKGKTAFLFVCGGQGKNGDLDTVELWNPVSQTWTLTQPMTEKRSGLAAVVINNNIYVLGGKINNDYTNTMEAYDLSDETWLTKASMNEARAHLCASVFKGLLYAVAGSKGNFLHVKTVERYDPDNDSWETLANIMASGNVGISSLGNRLICAGGKDSKIVLEYDEKNDKWIQIDNLHFPRAGYLLELPRKMNNIEFNWDVQLSKEVETSQKLLLIGNQDFNKSITLKVYDDNKNQWTQLSSLNVNRKDYSLAYVNENVFIIGGYSLDQRKKLKTVDSLNLPTGKLTQIEPLNSYRQNSAAVVVGQGKFKFIYVVGGLENSSPSRSVERWDSLSRKWFFMTPMTLSRSNHGVVLLNDEIYVIGGKVGDSFINTVEAFNFENNSWTSKASMNTNRADFGVTSFNNNIYVAGGFQNIDNPVKTVERYDPVRNVWTTIANISSEGAVGISSLRNNLICAGGTPSSIVEKYDEKNNVWIKLTSSSSQNVSFLTDLQSDIKIHSGEWIIQNERKFLENHQLVFFGYSNINDRMNTIAIYNIIKNEWKTTKRFTLIFNKNGNTANIIDNKLIFAGGFNGESHFNSVEGYNLLPGKKYEIYSPMKTTREFASSVVVEEGNKSILYVLGGFQNYSNTLASVEKWDPSTNKWSEGVSMLQERAGHCSVLLNGIIYVFGGETKYNTLNSVEAFSLVEKKWENKASMSIARSLFGAAVFNDYIYVVGGKEGKRPFNLVERYDPIKNSWTSLASIASSGHVGLCSVGNKLICAGGNEKFVQEYDEDENKWISLAPLERVQGGFLLVLPENAEFSS